jgi:hypothetical protein
MAANASAVASYDFAVDTIAPATPVLAATADGTSAIDLAWGPVADASSGVDYYTVFASDGTTLTTTPETSYRVEGLEANTTYGFYATATDVAGNTSARSEVASATTDVRRHHASGRDAFRRARRARRACRLLGDHPCDHREHRRDRHGLLQLRLRHRPVDALGRPVRARLRARGRLDALLLRRGHLAERQCGRVARLCRGHLCAGHAGPCRDRCGHRRDRPCLGRGGRPRAGLGRGPLLGLGRRRRQPRRDDHRDGLSRRGPRPRHHLRLLRDRHRCGRQHLGTQRGRQRDDRVRRHHASGRDAFRRARPSPTGVPATG